MTRKEILWFVFWSIVLTVGAVAIEWFIVGR